MRSFFSHACSLGWSDTVIDGFYMTHGDFPEVCDHDKFPSMEDLKKVRTVEGDTREVGRRETGRGTV